MIVQFKKTICKNCHKGILVRLPKKWLEEDEDSKDLGTSIRCTHCHGIWNMCNSIYGLDLK